jgi:hypothetical protein
MLGFVHTLGHNWRGKKLFNYSVEEEELLKFNLILHGVIY